MEASELTVSLGGCGALWRLVLLSCSRLALAACAPLQQPARLDLYACGEGVQVPWQHLRGLQELVVQERVSASVLEGATQLTTLQSLAVELQPGPMPVPPGPWLAGITRLLLQSFERKEVGCGGGAAARAHLPWRL